MPFGGETIDLAHLAGEDYWLHAGIIPDRFNFEIPNSNFEIPRPPPRLPAAALLSVFPGYLT